MVAGWAVLLLVQGRAQAGGMGYGDETGIPMRARSG